jgi:hypothetical protein
MEFYLTNNWTLILDKEYSVFVDTKNPNRYAVMDWRYDNVAFTITTAENTFDIKNHTVSLEYKVNIDKRTISFVNLEDE